MRRVRASWKLMARESATAAGEVVAADGEVAGEEQMRALGDDSAGAAGADVNVEPDGLLLGGAAIDAGEAIEQGQGLHVHGDNVEAGLARGGDESVDPTGVGGHDDDVDAGVVGVAGLAGDGVTQQRLGGVEGKFLFGVRADGVGEEFLVHGRQRQVLGVED